MNLQHTKHRLAKKFFKAAFFGSILIMALWGWTSYE